MEQGPEKEEKPSGKGAGPAPGGFSTGNKIGLLLLVLTILVVTATHFAMKDIKAPGQAAPASVETAPR